LALAACGSGSDDSKDGAKGADDGKTYKIGITKFVAHPSLDAVEEGFKAALEAKGVKVDVTPDDAQAEIANTTTIASKFAGSDLDLILAIATPSAQAMVNQIPDTPILFAAVTDPVGAGLVPSWEPSGTNVSGTSDLNPEGKPAHLVQEVLPDTKTIGFVYSLGEQNSVVQLKDLQAEAEELGMTVKEAGITNASELGTAVQTLKGVDVIYVGTDNTVVDALVTVVDFAIANQVPLFVADKASAEKGGAVARGIDYYEMGLRTGEMAYQILVEGVDVGTLAPLQVVDTEIVINPTSAEAQGLVIPPAIADAATVVETKQ